MPFRFRRSIKIAPGLRLSFGKKGASLRLGVRGMGISKSTTGRTTASAGIPGTGLGWTKSLSGASRSAKPARTCQGCSARLRVADKFCSKCGRQA